MCCNYIEGEEKADREGKEKANSLFILKIFARSFSFPAIKYCLVEQACQNKLQSTANIKVLLF